MSIASWTSPRVSASTFPISRVMRRASSSFRSRRISAARKMCSARRGAGTRRQEAKARAAAFTAASTSSGPESGKVPTTSDSRAGFRFSKVLPERDGSHFPPMRFRYWRPAGSKAPARLWESVSGVAVGALMNPPSRPRLRNGGLSNDDEMSFDVVTLRGFYMINIDSRDHVSAIRVLQIPLQLAGRPAQVRVWILDQHPHQLAVGGIDPDGRAGGKMDEVHPILPGDRIPFGRPPEGVWHHRDALEVVRGRGGGLDRHDLAGIDGALGEVAGGNADRIDRRDGVK